MCILTTDSQAPCHSGDKDIIRVYPHGKFEVRRSGSGVLSIDPHASVPLSVLSPIVIAFRPPFLPGNGIPLARWRVRAYVLGREGASLGRIIYSCPFEIRL